MSFRKKALFFVGGVVALTLALIGGLNALGGSSANAADGSLKVQITGATAGEHKINYHITLVNDTSSDVGNVYLSGNIPADARFTEVVATPAGSTSLGQQGNVVAWLVPTVPAKGKVGPFSYKVAPSGRFFGEAHGWAHWTSPVDGTAISDSITQDAVVLDFPKRGCKACHALRDETTGAVTIAYEAKVRGGPNHPAVGPGTGIPFESGPETCLQCHKPGTGARKDMGAVAPKMLRDIVHPVHLNSASFTGTPYKGNCFSCHNINGDGTFTLLGDKLKTDFRGIPLDPPVKGILPSENQ